MLARYWEKRPLTPDNWRHDLVAMSVADPEAVAAISQVIAEKGEALVSCYHFQRPGGEMGTVFVCHDLGRGLISWGSGSQWGHWDEGGEVLTLDATGEQYNYDGTPTYEGDDGSCSLGNF